MRKINYINLWIPMMIWSVISLSGCFDPKTCCTNIDVNVNILYKNGSGENLINSTPDFNASNIKIYYKNGSEYEYIYKSNLDAPNMYHLDDHLVLTVFPSDYYEGNYSTTLIELNKQVVDTLLCEFVLSENQKICKRAWLNGIEMSNRFIEVIK